MQKAEPQPKNVQRQPAARQGGGIVLASPQGEQIAQLEAMIESSSQAEKLGRLATKINDSPAMASQRKQADLIHHCQRQVIQQSHISGIHSRTLQRMTNEKKKMFHDTSFELRNEGKEGDAPHVVVKEIINDKDRTKSVEKYVVMPPGTTEWDLSQHEMHHVNQHERFINGGDPRFNEREHYDKFGIKKTKHIETKGMLTIWQNAVCEYEANMKEALAYHKLDEKDDEQAREAYTIAKLEVPKWLNIMWKRGVIVSTGKKEKWLNNFFPDLMKTEMEFAKAYGALDHMLYKRITHSKK